MIETLEDLIATATQPRKPKPGVPHNKIIAGLHHLIDEMASDIMASDGNIKVELFVNDLSIDARLRACRCPRAGRRPGRGARYCRFHRI